jgi:hypothetical protein
MTKCLLAAAAAMVALCLGTTSARADNITVFDGMSSGSSVGTSTTVRYKGVGVGSEDQETEPGTLQGEAWDLEAFRLDGTDLSMVGQWDFVDGVYHSGHLYRSGDVFIDVGSDGSWDYVFDVDWNDGTYDLYKGAFTTQAPTYIGGSTPWRRAAGGSLVVSGKSFTASVDNTLGFLGTSYDHTVIEGFDLGTIVADHGSPFEFTSHFTMECGNDLLIGSATIPTPEPTTLLLLGSGLIGLVGGARQRQKAGSAR